MPPLRPFKAGVAAMLLQVVSLLSLTAWGEETRAIEVVATPEPAAASASPDESLEVSLDELEGDSGATGGEDDDAEEVIDLGEVEAVSTRTLESAFGRRAALTIVELADRPPGTSLPEVIESLPGVDLRENGGKGQLSVAQVRGARGNQVLVLLDGQPLSPGQTADLSQLAVASLERIELLRGAEAARFGAGALGGVLNLVSRRPVPAEEPEESGPSPICETFTERLRPTHTELVSVQRLTVEAGSFGHVSSTFTANGPELAGGIALASAKNDYSFQRAGNQRARRLNNESRLVNGWLSGTGDFDWRFALSSLERGVPGSAEFPTLEASYSRDSLLFNAASQENSLRLGFALASESFSDPHPYLGAIPVDNDSTRGQFTLEGGAAPTEFGTGWRFALDAVDSSEYGRHERAGITGRWSAESRAGSSLLTASASLMLDSAGAMPPTVSLSLSHPAGKRASVYASSGYRFRRPDFEELFATGQGSLQGNPDLDPESCVSLEAGGMLASAHSHLQAALFADQYADSILFVPVSAYLVRAENTGRARVLGAEAAWQAQSGDVSMATAVTWLPIAEFASGIPLVARARVHSNSRLAYSYAGNAHPQCFVAATLDYTGSMTADLFGNLRIPPRAIAGLELSTEFSDSALALRVDNLFDRQARDSWNYPLPGRAYSLNLVLDL